MYTYIREIRIFMCIHIYIANRNVLYFMHYATVFINWFVKEFIAKHTNCINAYIAIVERVI